MLKRTSTDTRHAVAIVRRRNHDILIGTSADTGKCTSAVAVGGKFQSLTTFRSIRRNHAILGNRAVGTGNSVVAGVEIPILSESDCFPLRSCAGKLNARQTAVTAERTIAYALHAIRNHNARQAFAPIERIIAYARHAVSNGYARQTAATAERLFTYARHAVRYHNACQAGAIRERPFADTRHACRYHNALQAGAIRERPVADTRHAVRYHNARQAFATTERLFANAPHTVGDRHVAAGAPIFFQYTVADFEIKKFHIFSFPPYRCEIC